MAWAWVELDTADVFLSDVITEHARFEAVVADRADAPATQVADVVGCSCNWDQLIEQESLPDVATGDVIAFLGTGCYEEVSAANFNALPRPATVLVDGGDAYVVRRAETLVGRAQPRRLRPAATTARRPRRSPSRPPRRRPSPPARRRRPSRGTRPAPTPSTGSRTRTSARRGSRRRRRPGARSPAARRCPTRPPPRTAHAATTSGWPRCGRITAATGDSTSASRSGGIRPRRSTTRPVRVVTDDPIRRGDDEHRRDPGGADAEAVELQRQQRAQHPEQRAGDDHEPQAEQHVVVAHRARARPAPSPACRGAGERSRASSTIAPSTTATSATNVTRAVGGRQRAEHRPERCAEDRDADDAADHATAALRRRLARQPGGGERPRDAAAGRALDEPRQHRAPGRSRAGRARAWRRPAAPGRGRRSSAGRSGPPGTRRAARRPTCRADRRRSGSRPPPSKVEVVPRTAAAAARATRAAASRAARPCRRGPSGGCGGRRPSPAESTGDPPIRRLVTRHLHTPYVQGRWE